MHENMLTPNTKPAFIALREQGTGEFDTPFFGRTLMNG